MTETVTFWIVLGVAFTGLTIAVLLTYSFRLRQAQAAIATPAAPAQGWTWKWSYLWWAIGIILVLIPTWPWIAKTYTDLTRESYESHEWFGGGQVEGGEKKPPAPTPPWEPEKLKQELLMEAAKNGRVPSPRKVEVAYPMQRGKGPEIVNSLNFAHIAGGGAIEILQPRCIEGSLTYRIKVQGIPNPCTNWSCGKQRILDLNGEGHTFQIDGAGDRDFEGRYPVIVKVDEPKDGSIYLHTECFFLYEKGAGPVLPWHQLPLEFDGHKLNWVATVKFLKVVDQAKGWYEIPDPAEVMRAWSDTNAGAAVIFGMGPTDRKLCLEHVTTISSAEVEQAGKLEINMPFHDLAETWLVQVAVKITRK